jgi:sulfoxide reductase heme-binding subunit YedZ
MPLIDFLSKLFAINSLQFWWYLTRAAGLMGYFLLWLSTAWGLVVSSKILDTFMERAFTYDFHEYLSLLGLGFIAVHVSVLMADQYLPYSIWQVLVPFLSPYRPLWVGIGVITFYLSLLVTVTFYLKKHIGMSAFRKIHYLSLVAYVGATVHGLYGGTDSVLPLANFLYKGTFLVTLFLVAYWIVLLLLRKQEEEQLKKEQLREKSRHKARAHPAAARKRSY